MNNQFMPMSYRGGYRHDQDNDERGFALPLLAGLAITAPFWAGGFGCCGGYGRYGYGPGYGAGFAQPYPVPYPYPYPYPTPSPYYYYNRRPYIY